MSFHRHNMPAALLVCTALICLCAVCDVLLAAEKGDQETDETDVPRTIVLGTNEKTPTNFQHRTGTRGIVNEINKFKKQLPDEHKAKIYIEKFMNQNYGKYDDRISRIVTIGPEGKRDGIEKIYKGWHESSVVARIIQWEDGVRHGNEEIIDRSEEGRYVRKTIPWKDGRIEGTVKTYYPDGEVMSAAPYVDGKQEGVTKMWSDEGKLIQVIPYKNGKRHGTLEEYWAETGQKKKVVPCENGKVNGTVRLYYRDGTLRAEMPFQKDSLHGIEKRYDEEGDLERKRYWLDGERVPEGVFRDRYEKN